MAASPTRPLQGGNGGVANAAVDLKLYDTATHEVSRFEPIQPGKVGMYVCGATVQSSPHIGHIRAGVAFDIIRRWFLRLGYRVTFIRNVTDIDDKILDKAPPLVPQARLPRHVHPQCDRHRRQDPRQSRGGRAALVGASSRAPTSSWAYCRRRMNRAPPGTSWT